ncbi:MAG: putative DNA binding domain-containing protein [Bacteroidales bacterium]|nr:putative DNA binding domain-containing protein [Bacteroidales bacterium]
MPEQQNIEWKQSWRDEYLKWICGFANAKGGKLFIGKDDNGKIVGVENSKRLMDDIPNKIQNHLGIICDVNLYSENENQYIEIEVNPHDAPISYRGKYHYRSGSTKQELKGATLNEFLLKKVGKTWEEALEEKATFDEILDEAIEEFKYEAIRSQRYPMIKGETDYKKIFSNLRLYVDNSLKRSALVLFGKDPRSYIINAFVKIGKFGNSDSELLFQEVVEANAFQLADKTIEILEKKYFKKSISYEGLNRIETSEYPQKAVRECLLNAIIHRNYFGPPIQISIYDDKFMVWNSGQLPEELTIEDLRIKHASYPRNSIIADVFFKAGLIETWGRGTIKIIEECQKVGLPEPKFEIMSGGIAVTFFKDRFSEQQLIEQGLNERQVKAVKYLKKNDFITNSIYQVICETSERTALRDLEQLTEKQIFNKTGEKKGTKYKLNNGG